MADVRSREAATTNQQFRVQASPRIGKSIVDTRAYNIGRSSQLMYTTPIVTNETSKERSGMSNNYSDVTGFAKLDHLRFNGDKIKEWLFQIEQFFLIDHTPEELKVSFASIHFDDLAVTWHQWILQSVMWKHVRHDWVTYKMLLQGRFKELEVDPIVELKQLKETNGIVEYHEKFILLRTRVNLTEDYLVRAYLDGLQRDTRENVQMFQPQTVNQCFLVGRLYEQAHPLKRDSEMKAEEDKEVAEINVKIEIETKSSEKRAHEVILKEDLKEDLITQFQVPVSDSKSLRNIELKEENLELENLEYVVKNENLKLDGVQKYVNMKFEVDGDAVSIARQVFDSMPLETNLLRNMIKETFSKTWWFKFKAMTKPRLPRTESSNLDKSGLCTEYKEKVKGCLERLQASVLMKSFVKKKNKFSKTWFKLKDDCFMEDRFWKFKFLKRNLQMMREHGYTNHFKLMSDKREHQEMFIVARIVNVRCLLGMILGITKSDAGHGQQAVYEQILMVNERLLQTDLVIPMKNKKIKFSKRWWFKYKSVEEEQDHVTYSFLLIPIRPTNEKLNDLVVE
ncbi:Retrotransposon gag domain [Arabidopsis thaliana x Arabidopsis arenosa]|uniref:Retrotransposon gag domain n=1 Tax=Arabidopsis thaliana x Arabidopsis arenosa TaxID=1240361 RepID=A0A8T2A3G8_9BRAS|nr:Retrotransposon gag domain [Arabidopsis thaliana x Arabidopsis arenosa]